MLMPRSQFQAYSPPAERKRIRGVPSITSTERILPHTLTASSNSASALTFRTSADAAWMISQTAPVPTPSPAQPTIPQPHQPLISCRPAKATLPFLKECCVDSWKTIFV